jgi:Bacterial archaeo-eukaryotic release factor family 10
MKQVASNAASASVTAASLPPLGDPFARLELSRFRAIALTAYMPGSGHLSSGWVYHARRFEELAHRTEPLLDGRALEALRRELPAIVAYLETAHVPARLSVAVFACETAGLLETWRLRDSVEAELRLAERLDLEPIRRQLEAHPPALVLVADKERARLFTMVLHHVEELTSWTGQEVHVQRQGGASALNWQHKQDEHARGNLEQAAGWLAHAESSFMRRLFLAGPPEARAQLRRILPAPWVDRVAGELHLPLYASAGEIANRLREAC